MLRRRTLFTTAFAIVLGAVAGIGCQGGGNFSILGYTTKPPFDPNIRSVYIPVFKMQPYFTSPHRGIEADLTREIVEELNRRHSPIRVVSDPARADTELIGTLVVLNKNIQNRTPQNLNREFDVYIGADVVWRDLRSGKILSGTRAAPPRNDQQFDPSLPPPAEPPPDGLAFPVFIAGYGRVFPELGESDTTGAQAAIKQIARKIVDLMEAPWPTAGAPQ